MKVLFISYAEAHSNKWVNALCQKGHEVFFVMQKSHVNHVEKLDSRVIVIELPIRGKKGYVLNAGVLKRIVKRISPDVVNVHYGSGYGLLARLANVKNEVLTVWGSDVYDFPYESPIKNIIIKRNLRHAKIITTVSDNLVVQVEKLIGKCDNVFITHFGEDTEYFSRKRFENVKKDRDVILIGNIKAITPKYGIDDLINAFELLRKDLQANKETEKYAHIVRCVIYGPGELRQNMIDLVKEKKLEGYISLPGEVSYEEIPKLMSEMDIFCCTSVLDSDAFGVVVVDAEAMSLPVVATDVAGFKEVVEDGITGIIVEKRNVTEIANALKILVIDENLRRTMGERGRKRFENKYDFKKNVEEMERAYKAALGNSKI